jgi:hypothetical protein
MRLIPMRHSNSFWPVQLNFEKALSVTKAILSRFQTNGYTTALLTCVLCGTFALYFYRINSPLWLDEIYSYKLAKLGIREIIQNSWSDPHPPLYYGLQWMLSGFGHIKNEVGWRWFSVLCGGLSILGIWQTVLSISDLFSTVMGCIVAATLPSVVFFSQEARPFALMLLISAMSTWLLTVMLKDIPVKKMWVAWTIVSLLGLYSGYAYLMIVIVQVAFLGYYYYGQFSWWASCALVLIGFALLLPFAISSLTKVAFLHANSEPLTFVRTLQTLFAGDPIRYGFSLAHIAFPALTIGLSVAAFERVRRSLDRRILYAFLQVLLPIIWSFTVVKPLVGIRLPLQESKQFLVLLPSSFVLITAGIQELYTWSNGMNKLGMAFALGICGIMLSMNLHGLYRYWNTPKSPEGLLIVSLRDKLQPKDRIVSLHYSLNFALGFYISHKRVYLNPQRGEEGYKFILVDSKNLFEQSVQANHIERISQIRENPRVWILTHVTDYREPLDELISGCQITYRESFSPFEALLAECRSQP